MKRFLFGLALGVHPEKINAQSPSGTGLAA